MALEIRRCGQEIKRLLIKTWFPFFARFGSLTEIQKKAIPVILKGENSLLISPAATGKTEAVVAPVIERIIASSFSNPAILYISPTRALVNDLFRRLEDPISALNLTIKRKTGDRPTFDERKPPFLLLTTPESFDSLLCRHPKVFKNLKAVILDELHLLDSNPRGDQLRCLLKRLSLINPSLQFTALSATIEDKRMAERYFPNPVVIETGEKREIEYQLLPIGRNERGKITERCREELVKRLFNYLKENSLRKILFFFNARSLAESFSKSLSKDIFEKRVWVHHASLTKERREEVEGCMNRERIGILCATSTLELGIDIGDIDCVCLYRPPFSVSSLLQRIGRGNRRRDKIFAIGIYENPFERLLFEIFFSGAREGRFYEKTYRKSLSTLPQQIISYSFQRRRIGTTLASLYNALTPIYSEEEIKATFDHLLEEGFLTSQKRGIYFLSPALERKVELGKIHTNIQEKSFGEYMVFDIITGKEIGIIYYPREKFILGGRTWEMVEIREKEKRIYAKPLREEEGATKIFEGTGTGGYFYLLAQKIKKTLFPGLAENEFPYFREKRSLYAFHFLGSLYGSFLEGCYRKEGLEWIDIGGKVFLTPADNLWGSERIYLPIPKRETIELQISEWLFRLEDALGVGSFFRLLPDDLKIRDLAIALDIAGLIEFMKGLEFVELPKDECLLMLEGYV